MRMVRFFFTRRLIFTVCPDIATVGETREAYRAAGKAANIAKISVTATLAKSIGSFTVLAALMAEFSSEVLFAMNISGLRTPVAAINAPFADRVPISSPTGSPAPQRIKSCTDTKR